MSNACEVRSKISFDCFSRSFLAVHCWTLNKDLMIKHGVTWLVSLNLWGRWGVRVEIESHSNAYLWVCIQGDTIHAMDANVLPTLFVKLNSAIALENFMNDPSVALIAFIQRDLIIVEVKLRNSVFNHRPNFSL